jgi:lipoprotein signal peptidase
MIDRVFLGYVVDFFDFCAFPKLWKWVFNVADVFVCVGAGLLALWLILDIIKDYKAEKAKKALESGAAVETEASDKGDGDDRAE